MLSVAITKSFSRTGAGLCIMIALDIKIDTRGYRISARMKNRATAMIFRNGKLLLMRRQKQGRDYYILPGGGVDLDESFEDACIREVKEETGLDVLGMQRVFHYFYRGSEEVYFIARVPPDEPVLGGSEAARQSPTNIFSFEWIDPGQLQEINLLPVAARRICLEIIEKFRAAS